jgi:hypothetical protein
VNQEVEQYLRLFTNYHQDDWLDWIDIAEFTLNDHTYSAIKHSPFFLIYGFHPHNPSLAYTPNISTSPDALQYIIALKDIRKQAKLNLEKVSQMMKSIMMLTKVKHGSMTLGPKYGWKGQIL